MGSTFNTVCELALALPGVEAGMSYGTPALKVKGKLLSRLKEDGETIVVRVDFEVRDALLAAAPETFYITDHYRGYPAVLVRLSRISREELRQLLEEAWRGVAPKRLAAAFDSPRPPPTTRPRPPASSRARRRP